MDVDRVEFVDESTIRAIVVPVFEHLRTTLEELLPRARIEHVGATAVPGAVTKGDLDICVLVERNAFEGADRVLAEHYARNVGSDQTGSLSSFVVSSKPVPIGVQLVVRDGQEDFFVRWRDLLRRSPEVLKDYNQIKRRWHGRSHRDYRMAKSAFIEATLRAARGA
jgi:GrpB-like predicted nucleotidyltransferase (UPF0157 family)